MPTESGNECFTDEMAAAFPAGNPMPARLRQALELLEAPFWIWLKQVSRH
jgi:hypothetical protein